MLQPIEKVTESIKAAQKIVKDVHTFQSVQSQKNMKK